MDSYTWKITDKTLITQIKAAKQSQKFFSPPFRLFNLPFEFELYPNGTDIQGDVEIYLNICGLSPKVKSIHMKRKYTFLEVNATDNNNCTVTNEKMYCHSWPEGHVKTAHIQKLNQMTFKVDVTLYSVFNQDDEDITNQYLTQDPYGINNNNKKRSLNEANIININPPNKKRKSSNNNNNNNNIDNIEALISDKIEELSDLNKQKQMKDNNFKNMYEKEKNRNRKLAKDFKHMYENKQNSDKQIKSLNEKINIYNGTSNSIRNDRLDLEQLNALEKALMNGLQCISKSRERLIDKNKCIVCRVNNKNMVFLDGCNHMVLCMQCENKLNAKQCPMCRTKYTNARKLNL